ncbi:hypothetical protein E2C01_061334 [Portunus trituberculatus]|uniref:Uncharacterized protein n=1 Tax=Portunus trituberculatus TaxID=210409 RepID=A0A5B7HE39_PORTR|nr:hypothetical protein [Portunus trituberculatus]
MKTCPGAEGIKTALPSPSSAVLSSTPIQDDLDGCLVLLPTADERRKEEQEDSREGGSKRTVAGRWGDKRNG